MIIEELTGKRVVILGYGREGRAMEKALPECDYEVRDQKHGPDYLEGLDQFEVVIKSPGIPPDLIKVPVTNSTQIFLDTVQARGATVIGVTGSKGKSTTASLIYEILKTAGRDVRLVGNIGEPAIAHISKANEGVLFVLEMSSFQLMDLTTSPQIAVITSLFPEHLDYHGSLEAYKEAKANIARFKECSVCIYHESTKELVEGSSADCISYSEADSPVTLSETELLGTHNISNIAGACKVTRHLGIPEDVILNTIKTFQGLPHRLQSLGTHHGIEWIDDAISTTPDSTAAALEALGENVRTIIVGGKDRGVDLQPLIDAIKKSKIEVVIGLGETASKIEGAVIAKTMEEAVAIAKEKATNYKLQTTNSICLLSPAAPSYDLYKDFEKKGEAFKKCIL